MFYVGDPVHCQSALFLLAAIALEAVSVVLNPNHDHMLGSSELLSEAAPVCPPNAIWLISKVCATLCWAYVISFEGFFVPWESLKRAGLLENGVVTTVSHIAGIYVVSRPARNRY
jgi:hypothetical protein